MTGLTPAVAVPPEWYKVVGHESFAGPCTSDSRAPSTSAAMAECVHDIHANVSVSLDGGSFFSPPLPLVFGWVAPLKVSWLFVGPITDLGWTYSHNKGRLSVEDKYGGLVDAARYEESVPEGEFETQQTNRGRTIATGTPVNNLTSDGTPSAYYPAFALAKQLCDEDYDIVFATSFGFQSQMLDVAASYEPCRRAATSDDEHWTHFVGTAFTQTNSLTSTMFGKIYQMRYLSGIVAGASLTRSNITDPGSNLCVAYIAAFPIPEVVTSVASVTSVTAVTAVTYDHHSAARASVMRDGRHVRSAVPTCAVTPVPSVPMAQVQRGINAFTLGCRSAFASCIVKVLWVGTWHSAEIEEVAAHFF